MTPEVGTGQFKKFPFLSNYHPPPICGPPRPQIGGNFVRIHWVASLMYLISNMILTTNHIQTSCEWTQNFFLCCSICSTFSFYGPNKFHLKKTSCMKYAWLLLVVVTRPVVWILLYDWALSTFHLFIISSLFFIQMIGTFWAEITNNPHQNNMPENY